VTRERVRENQIPLRLRFLGDRCPQSLIQQLVTELPREPIEVFPTAFLEAKSCFHRAITAMLKMHVAPICEEVSGFQQSRLAVDPEVNGNQKGVSFAVDEIYGHFLGPTDHPICGNRQQFGIMSSRAQERNQFAPSTRKCILGRCEEMLPMNTRELLQRISSVGTAAAALFGASHSDGSPFSGGEAVLRSGRTEKPIAEPLVLKPAAIPEDPLLLAGHSSHRSHSSHTSHSSGSSGGGYAPTYPSAPAYSPPTYAPRTYTPPSYSPPSPGPSGTLPAATPLEVRRAVPVSPVTQIEFNNGLILYGYVLAKSEEGISFRTLDNAKTYKFKRGLLKPGTLAALGLTASTAQR
jgi:hypothetical protein